ncbi:MAG: triple tyrosine motif-containing protein, partial [Flavobacteriales bacterium]
MIDRVRKEFGDITRVALSGQYVYYYCSNAVFKVLREDCAVISTWNHKVSEPFTGFLLLHGAAFVNVIKLGLHRLTEKSYTPVKGGEILAGTQILFYFKYDSKHVLLGTSDNKLYLYDGKVFKDYKTNVDEYLQESVIAGGRNIGKNEFVLSTVTGGCIFISKKGQKSSHIVNYQTGLPDDEIYALGTDNKGGVWASHEYGISRIDNTLPIRNYSNYPGLEGNVISMIKYDSTIYVSTSEGVYYLSKAKSYKEIEVLVKVAEKRKPPSVQQAFQPQLQTVPEPEHTKDGQENKTKKKQNFFQKLFKKKKNKEQSKQISGDENKHPAPTREEEVPTAQTPHKPQGGQTSVSHRKKKIYAIQSVRHIYKKVQGLNEKCKQLIISNKHLLVATNTGVYDISDNHALAIVKNFYVNQIAHSKNKRRLFVGTAEGLLSLLFANNEWQVEQNFRDFHENAFTLIEDDRHHLWVGSENMVYDIVLDKTASPVYTKSYVLQSSSSEFILVRNVFGRPFFFLSNGVYSYDEKRDTIFYNEKINRDFQANSRFIYSQENITWVYNGKSWVSLNRIADITALDETYLELFDDIQNIYVDDVKNIWIIDGHNNLYKILPFSSRSAKQLFNVYIRQVSGESGQLFSISNLELDYKHNSISFRISAPYYVKKEATEYQYIVEGLMKTWTKWSTDPNIELPFIPAGHYRFRVRARNVLGELSKEKSFDFRIIPPFWNSWWFYTLCGLLALSLFYGLLKFRESNLKRSKMLLEEKVKIRTEQLEKEKVKSEELLLNILPSETAEEL